jgi:hypothetical protein
MIRLTRRAWEAVHVGNIALAWIEEAIATRDFVEADPRHPERR